MYLPHQYILMYDFMKIVLTNDYYNQYLMQFNLENKISFGRYV